MYSVPSANGQVGESFAKRSNPRWISRVECRDYSQSESRADTSAGSDSKPSVPAERFRRGRRKSLPGMNCPEKRGLSRNSGTVHRGVGG